MSTLSKKTLFDILLGCICFCTYIIFAFGRYSPSINNVSEWAKTILIFILISVCVQIIFKMLLSIFLAIKTSIQEKNQTKQFLNKIIYMEIMEDEMEIIIQQKSSRISFVILIIGFILFLSLLSFEISTVISLNILLFNFFIASILEGIFKIYYYEKGVNNG